uniref:metalloproteinase inhibitor 2-like n=1 Tax=Doryrhamphus excisus TaxID=161450 RepID=UPI0025ADB725|nr:metalloproteinase inhibitor 2-like [Doryrhamphus excisus]
MMSWTVKTLVLPLVLLCVWRLQEGAQACFCPPVHPQTLFCHAGFVIKAKVLAQTAIGDLVRNDIQQIQMFKGPPMAIDAIYTTTDPGACALSLNQGGEYLLSGRRAPDGLLHVMSCDYFAPWDSLTATEKLNWVHRYQKGCDCQITPCQTGPCSIRSAACLWTDPLPVPTLGEQAKNLVCLKRKDGCAWYGVSPSKGGKKT